MSADVCTTTRGPLPGAVIGERCACGHTNLVHDDGGCVMCALRAIAPADPPPSLRERVAQAWCADYYGEFSGSAKSPDDTQLTAADAVLAVVADWLAAQPHYGAVPIGRDPLVVQRNHDVALLRGGSA